LRPLRPLSDSVAVVLAAGLGSRLRAVQEKPKGFVEIGGEPIIARSVRALQRAGLREFVFVVGWHADVYRVWGATGCPGAIFVDNPEYATTGSLCSLLLGAAAVPGRNLVVVESDLLYEPRAPELLLAAPDADTVLISGFTQSGDEVWAYERAPRQLGRLTKQRAAGAPPAGELVGLTRMSIGLVADLVIAARTLPASAHYEDGLNVAAETRPVSLLPVSDLAWCEIDDPAHLARARQSVWPRVAAAEAVAISPL
jgi:2-aminoethylphosphonate-pyruvate transaminase